MSLPVSALSDLELLHYASIDDSAQAELARRCGTSEGLELHDYVKKLEGQVDKLQKSQDDSCLSCDCNDSDMEDCIGRVRKLLNGYEAMTQAELTEAVKEALGEMADF